MSKDTTPTYRFTLERRERYEDDVPGPHSRDRNPASITALASTEQEAHDKVLALSGEPPRFHSWVIRTLRVDEVEA